MHAYLVQLAGLHAELGGGDLGGESILGGGANVHPSIGIRTLLKLGGGPAKIRSLIAVPFYVSDGQMRFLNNLSCIINSTMCCATSKMAAKTVG